MTCAKGPEIRSRFQGGLDTAGVEGVEFSQGRFGVTTRWPGAPGRSETKGVLMLIP